MKPIRLKNPPCEIIVERGILKKAGSLLAPPGGGPRRFLWLCSLPDTDPAPSALLASLARAGHTVVRIPDEEYPVYPADVDAIIAVGDDAALGADVLLANDRYPGAPTVLVPTTFYAQLAFPFGDAAGLVLCDPSLPVRDADVRRGIVELIRYAVGFDRTIFDLLYTDFDRGALIRRCLSIRCDLLAADKTDLFDRLGAPIGLAVSAALEKRDGSDFDQADALAIGLAAATRYALRIGYCRRDFLSDLVGLLTYHGLPHSALVTDRELISSFADASWADGRTNLLSLPRRLGECGLREVDPETLTGLLPS